MTSESSPQGYSQAEAAAISKTLTSAFKDILPLEIIMDPIIQPKAEWSRYGLADKSTGRYELYIRVPVFWYERARDLASGTAELYHTITDTLAQHGVARSYGVKGRYDTADFYSSNDSSPTQAIPLDFTTNDMRAIEAAVEEAAQAVQEKLKAVERDAKILDDKGLSARVKYGTIYTTPSFDMRGDRYYPTERGGQQLSLLNRLNAARAIKCERVSEGYAVQVLKPNVFKEIVNTFPEINGSSSPARGR